MAPSHRGPRSSQLSFDDLGPELIDVEFVVFDLETTGTHPETDAITEIGAVRVVGGEVVEEFQTFVNPERPIPAFIARLTGINDHMVADAPSIGAVLPMFLEFARTSVLVAHNARFDVGFMKAKAAALGYRWPAFQVVDTLPLARQTFARDEVPNHKLGTLAKAVGATTVPNHRALSDARATVDVLHHIIARLPGGVHYLSDLTSSTKKASAAQIRARHLTKNAPALPGVYSFLDASGDVMYVGKSRNLRSRVRTYFTPQETRRAVLDIIPALERIDFLPCSSDTEASIIELRLIQDKKPRANRSGIRPSTGQWLRLGNATTGIRHARVVHPEESGEVYIGPLRSSHDVEPVRSLLYSALSQKPADRSPRTYGDSFRERARVAMSEDPEEVFAWASSRMRALSERGQFEAAAAVRERVELFAAAAMRAARLRALASVPLLVAARKVPAGGPTASSPAAWEIFSLSHGRLMTSCSIEAWRDPLVVARDLARENERVEPSPLCFGRHQEAELLLEWLSSPGVRIAHVEGEFSMPRAAAFNLERLRMQFHSSGSPRSSE